MTELFRTISRRVSAAIGSPISFIAALLLTFLWVVGGFFFGFTGTYQLYYNTAVSAITWLLVILLQGSQNADTQALQLKLNELLRAQDGARTGLVDLENMSQADLELLAQEFVRLRTEEHTVGQEPQPGQPPERQQEDPKIGGS